MVTSISRKTPVARKEYNCQSCEIFADHFRDNWRMLTFSEKKIVVKAFRHDNRKIKIGEKYEYQYNTDGGDVWVYRSKIGMDSIMYKYNLFPEE